MMTRDDMDRVLAQQEQQDSLNRQAFQVNVWDAYVAAMHFTAAFWNLAATTLRGTGGMQ